jgi:hypothetical protein
MALSPQDREFITMVIEPLKMDIIAAKEQLTKINGRVNKHDEMIHEALIERSKNREHQSEVCKDLEAVTSKVDKIEGELLEYRFMRAYPKIFLTGAVIFGLAAIFLFLANIGII